MRTPPISTVGGDPLNQPRQVVDALSQLIPSAAVRAALHQLTREPNGVDALLAGVWLGAMAAAEESKGLADAEVARAQGELAEAANQLAAVEPVGWLEQRVRGDAFQRRQAAEGEANRRASQAAVVAAAAAQLRSALSEYFGANLDVLQRHLTGLEPRFAETRRRRIADSQEQAIAMIEKGPRHVFEAANVLGVPLEVEDPREVYPAILRFVAPHNDSGRLTPVMVAVAELWAKEPQPTRIADVLTDPAFLAHPANQKAAEVLLSPLIDAPLADPQTSAALKRIAQAVHARNVSSIWLLSLGETHPWNLSSTGLPKALTTVGAEPLLAKSIASATPGELYARLLRDRTSLDLGPGSPQASDVTFALRKQGFVTEDELKTL